MKTLVLIDLSVIAHKANAQRLAENLKRVRGHLSSWCKANLSMICGLDWLDIPGLDKSQVAIVFAVDSKPYWRSIELKKLGISYKKGRKSRTRKGLSYLKKVMIKEIESAGIPVIGYPGQEADDVAALFARTKPETISLVLCTTDNDWIGLVNPSLNVSWYCSHGYLPRHRPSIQSVQQSRQGKESGIQDLRDFYRLKQQMGDLGDNLPPGCPLWAVDLLDPLPEYDPLSIDHSDCLTIYEQLDRHIGAVAKLGLSKTRAARFLVQSNSTQWIS